MSALDRNISRFTIPAEARQRASQPAPAAWYYTLAHAETPLRERALSEDDLRDLVETLRARTLPLPAELASPRASARRASGSGPLSGARYIWAFSSLRDALQAARANRRSDYHAYPQPATLREASLDRLYRRFPLDEFPRTTVILFSGAPICPDPLLGADPAPGSLAAELADVTGPELWDRYTLCGFRRGASLVRVTPADRWVRMSPRALEDAWAIAERHLYALAAPDADEGDTPPGQRSEPGAMETVAFQALLCALTGATPDQPAAAPRMSQAPLARHARRR
jgi:hypothetical protein